MTHGRDFGSGNPGSYRLDECLQAIIGDRMHVPNLGKRFADRGSSHYWGSVPLDVRADFDKDAVSLAKHVSGCGTMRRTTPPTAANIGIDGHELAARMV